MTCPSRMPDHPLTANQQDHLQRLFKAGCLNREAALSAYEIDRVVKGGMGINPNIVGALIDKELADKRTRTTPSGVRAASYWLNDAGAARARELLGLPEPGADMTDAAKVDLTDPKILLLAVQNADILRCIGTQDRPQSGSQIAAAIGRDKSNTHKSIAKLAEAGLVQADHGGLTSAGHELLPRLDALEGKAAVYPHGGTPEASPDADLTTLTHAEIEPDPDNPRKAFDPADIAEFAEDLGDRFAEGKVVVLQNLVVHKGHGGARWRLAAGERRWRALGRAIEHGIIPDDFPIPVRKLPFADATERRDRLELALVENLQRVDLDRIDEGRLYRDLVEIGAGTAEIALKARRSQRHVQQHIQLLDLSPEDRVRVKSGELGFKAALELLQDHRDPQTAPPPAEAAGAGASGARTAGEGADNAASAAPTGEGAAAHKPDVAPSKAGTVSERIAALVAEGPHKGKDLLAFIEMQDWLWQRAKACGLTPEAAYDAGVPNRSAGHGPRTEMILGGWTWGRSKPGQDGIFYSLTEKAIGPLTRHGLICTDETREKILASARLALASISSFRPPTPYVTRWLNVASEMVQLDAIVAEGQATPDTLKVSGSASAPAGGSGFSVSTPASAARPDGAAIAATLDVAQHLHLGEIGWAVRIAGAFVGHPSGRMVRSVDAPRANEDAVTRQLANGAGGLPKLYEYWIHALEGPQLALTEAGRQALKHFAPALGNLDALEAAAFVELDVLRAAAGVDETTRKALAEREQSTVTWLNEVLPLATDAEAGDLPAPIGDAPGDTEIPGSSYAEWIASRNVDGAILAARLLGNEMWKPGDSVPYDEVASMIAEAFVRGQRRAHALENMTQACRVCGCTDYAACDDDGQGCGWASPDVCTVCAAFLPAACAEPSPEPEPLTEEA